MRLPEFNWVADHGPSHNALRLDIAKEWQRIPSTHQRPRRAGTPSRCRWPRLVGLLQFQGRLQSCSLRLRLWLCLWFGLSLWSGELPNPAKKTWTSPHPKKYKKLMLNYDSLKILVKPLLHLVVIFSLVRYVCSECFAVNCLTCTGLTNKKPNATSAPVDSRRWSGRLPWRLLRQYGLNGLMACRKTCIPYTCIIHSNPVYVMLVHINIQMYQP